MAGLRRRLAPSNGDRRDPRTAAAYRDRAGSATDHVNEFFTCTDVGEAEMGCRRRAGPPFRMFVRYRFNSAEFEEQRFIREALWLHQE
jgi:hypothetical protein